MSRETKTLLVVVAIFFLICAPTVNNLLSGTIVYLPKTGRVLDAMTNQGMENVFVIATADYSGQNLVSGSYGGTIYRIIVRTDAHGEYHIPSTWVNAHLWFPPVPGTAPNTLWRISAFKPGYATDGDEESWSNFDKYGRPVRFPRSVYSRATNAYSFGTLKVDPFMMKPVQLNLKEAAVYYDAVTKLDRKYRTQSNTDEVALREVGMEVLLPQLCSLDSFKELDLTTFQALRDFAIDIDDMDNRIKQLEPQNWAKDDSARPRYLAGDVCQAMKAGGTSQ